jgi:hypothetical protein
MPVQLPQRPRLERSNRRSNRLRHGEVATINRLDRSATAGDFLGGDLAGLEDVRAVAFEFAVGGVDGEVGGAEVCSQNVRVWGWDGGEEVCVDAWLEKIVSSLDIIMISPLDAEQGTSRRGLTKTLGQNIFRSMRDPIIHIKTRPRRLKVPIIKDERILVLLRQPLDNMCLTLGEVPDIAFIQHLDLVAAVLVHGADGHLAVVSVAPLGDAVPVHLADAVLGQVLLGAGDVVAGGQVGDDLLAHPAAGQLPSFGVGEASFEVLDGAGVGGFLA